MSGFRSYSRYRSIDLALFAVMLIVFEGIIVMASTRWFAGQPYTVSVVPLIVAIVMMRWGPWAGVHAVLGGFVFCLLSKASPRQYVIYCVGNLFSLGALLLIRRQGDGAIRADALKTWVYGLAVLLLIHLGRGLLSMAFGASVPAALGFITTDVITALFTLVILWFVRKLDGMLENQNHYLLRLQEEQEEERGGYR